MDDKYKETIIVKAGKSLALEIPFNGSPEPTVTWTYNGGDLPSKKRMVEETVSGLTCLRLSKVQRSDSGDYNLQVVNENGKVEVTIKVIVLGMWSI